MLHEQVPTEVAIILKDPVMEGCGVKPPRYPRRRVRIVEAENKYYNSDKNSVDATLWYKLQDFITFQQDARQLAAKLQATSDPQSWSNSMMRVYFVLRVARTVDEVQKVVESTDICLDETTLGLSARYLTPINSDFLVRRHHLLQQIFMLQNTYIPSQSHREALIQETSLLSSHAARMYASFVAQALL